jgi:hypothetical protein
MIQLAFYSQSMTTEIAINKVIDELVGSWNTYYFGSLERNSTIHMNWINNVGTWWKDRKTAVAAHFTTFNAVFNGVNLKNHSQGNKYKTNQNENLLPEFIFSLVIFQCKQQGIFT